MAKTLQEVEALAKELSETEQELLSYRLYRALRPLKDEADEEYKQEIERRVREIEDGTAELVDFDSAIAEISAELNEA